MATGELACTYATLILHDDGIPVTKRNIDDLIMNVGSGGAAAPVAAAAAPVTAAPDLEEKKEVPKEESCDEGGLFDLFN